MFCVNGGNYEGMNYSTMYYTTDKYIDVSPNGKYYVHLGNIDEQEDESQRHAILVFDKETDKLVYAEEADTDCGCGDYNEFHHRKARELFNSLDWLKN